MTEFKSWMIRKQYSADEYLALLGKSTDTIDFLGVPVYRWTINTLLAFELIVEEQEIYLSWNSVIDPLHSFTTEQALEMLPDNLKETVLFNLDLFV